MGGRPPVPLWRKQVRVVVGEPIEFDLPGLRAKARSVSRELTFRSLGWPRTQRDDLDEAAQRWLYMHISDHIRSAMETLRTSLHHK